MNQRQIVVTTGLIDAASIVVMAFIAAFLMHRAPPTEPTSFLRFSANLITSSIPVAVIVGWRGARHTTRLLKGEKEFVRPVLEGFITGFAVSFLVLTFGALNEALTAGGYWDDAATWGLSDWLYYFWFTTKFSAAIGLVGAAIAVPISGINRAVIRTWRAS